MESDRLRHGRGRRIRGMRRADKSCAHLLNLGVSTLFESWQPYFLLGAGILGMVLAQSAFQAGPLDASLPTLSATDPIVSVFIGAAAFGETVRTGIVPTTVEVVSFVAIVVGIFMLAHTDVVKVAQRHYTQEQERERAKPDAGAAPADGPPTNGLPRTVWLRRDASPGPGRVVGPAASDGQLRAEVGCSR